MDGIILVNKPKGITSFGVVDQIKKVTHRKVGHCGTLDPNAQGLLVCLVGSATKCLDFLNVQDKTYQATCLLGVKTDTQDIWGRVLEEKRIPDISRQELDRALKDLSAMKVQEVPIVSAKKIAGKKLLDYHRKQEKVDLPLQAIQIHDLSLLAHRGNEIDFEVSVSKGTYVRTLCQKLGENLGTLACMSYLNRTRCGIFHLKDAYNLDQVLKEPESCLLNIKQGLGHYPWIYINDPLPIYQGKSLDKPYQGDRLVVLGSDERVLAIYDYDQDQKIYRSKRGIW